MAKLSHWGLWELCGNAPEDGPNSALQMLVNTKPDKVQGKIASADYSSDGRGAPTAQHYHQTQ